MAFKTQNHTAERTLYELRSVLLYEEQFKWLWSRLSSQGGKLLDVVKIGVEIGLRTYSICKSEIARPSGPDALVVGWPRGRRYSIQEPYRRL
jgi:hypothetical protein